MAVGKLESVSAGPKHTLSLVWDDGHTAAVSLAGIVAAHPGLKPVRTAKAFARAKLSRDRWSVEWPGGIDFGATQLRRWAGEQAGDVMPVADFRAWMEAHALTLDTAAKALGLSRRMIAYYQSGEKPIPRTVMLATKGWAAGKDRKPRQDVMV